MNIVIQAGKVEETARWVLLFRFKALTNPHPLGGDKAASGQRSLSKGNVSQVLLFCFVVNTAISTPLNDYIQPFDWTGQRIGILDVRHFTEELSWEGLHKGWNTVKSAGYSALVGPDRPARVKKHHDAPSSQNGVEANTKMALMDHLKTGIKMKDGA